jgi:AcrR family transcriptional regulator
MVERGEFLKIEGRSESWHERHQELVSATYRLIVEKGIEGLRVRDIAAKVGINNATLHYYFPTKEKLLEAVVQTFAAQFKSLNVDATAENNKSALERYHEHFRLLEKLFSETPESVIVMSELIIHSRRDATVQRILETAFAGWEATLTSIFEDGIKAGVLRADLEAKNTAREVITFCAGLCLLNNFPRLDFLQQIAPFKQKFLSS